MNMNNKFSLFRNEQNNNNKIDMGINEDIHFNGISFR